MIEYDGGVFGFRLLFRLHGSAVFKALLPALVSTIAYIILYETTSLHEEDSRLFDSPYPMSALLVAFSFLLTFKMSFSYNRYWEAMTAVYQMHSKWMDAGMELASFHYQSSGYNKPPSFGEHPEITELLRERERLEEPTMQEMEDQIDKITAETSAADMSLRSRFRMYRTQNRASRVLSAQDIAASMGESDEDDDDHEHDGDSNDEQKDGEEKVRDGNTEGEAKAIKDGGKQVKEVGKKDDKTKPDNDKKEEVTEEADKKDKPAGKLSGEKDGKKKEDEKKPAESDDRKSIPPETAEKKRQVVKAQEGNVVSFLADTIFRRKPTVARRTIAKGMMPSLFLQEAAHLLSLLSAVAMSTLRNDLEHAESPLATFYPNSPWPCVDPDSYSADVRKDWARSKHTSYTAIRYLLGVSRTDKSRTLYNAARPFRVVGGVSDAEVKALQSVKGPLAKVALCTMWWQEFISREYLAGSTGKVAPPIISRLYQFTSDGMLGYNNARKIAYIPFPFPHSQITSLYSLAVLVLIPTLNLSYVENEAYGAILNFLTVLCFSGFYEVARELENPFVNVPNDIPLNNFHAQFNEALMTMYSGYHPESFWEIEGEKIVTAKVNEADEGSPPEPSFVVK